MNAVTVGSAVSRLYDGYEDGYVEGFDLKLIPSSTRIGLYFRCNEDGYGVGLVQINFYITNRESTYSLYILRVG